MIVLLSPAKSLDFEAPSKSKNATDPQFTKQAAQLIKTLKGYSAEDLGKLMKLSETLSELNHGRYKSWKSKHDSATSKQSIFAFQGDVYQGLEVDTLGATEIKRLQKHVRILSGLYGVLRPLDWMQPYRLEMGTKLKTDAGKDLYQFWGETIRDAISADLRGLKSDLIINLASNEYSRSAKLSSIDATVVSPVFKDWKNGEYKLISFFAKRARGLMARYLITNKVTSIDGIQGFDLDGYRYDKKLSKLSTALAPIFTRKQTA